MWTSLVHLHLPLRPCLKGNAGDDVQSVAGRVLGRILHVNGRGMEPRVLLTSRRGIRAADLCTFLQNMHVRARMAAQLNLGSVARTDMCCAAVLYQLMVTGGEALPLSQHSCAREVATEDVRRGEEIQPG